MTLETTRLLLRPWEESDAPRLYALARDPDIGPRAGWPVHTDEADSLAVIRGPLGAPETYAVVCKATGQVVGSMGLKPPDARFESVAGRQLEIGYWLGRDYWGQGLTPEGVERLLRRAFAELDCAAVWCAHYDFNAQSRRVIEKSGFRWRLTKQTVNLLGATHTTLFYAITKEEWMRR